MRCSSSPRRATTSTRTSSSRGSRSRSRSGARRARARSPRCACRRITRGARQLLADARAARAAGAAGAAEIAELAAFLERVVASRRELGHLVGDVARAAANLDQPLLVTVMGEFSSGKSSFVNAFIGADVAPTGITPTTATINVVRYGRERGGRIIGARRRRRSSSAGTR